MMQVSSGMGNVAPPHVTDIAIEEFQASILTWYDSFKRDLPWRGDPDPYRILVSEIMLQQTQVDRVIPKYFAFLERFPTFASLAEASAADVIRQWQGLGHNRRAMLLKRTADTVCGEYGGVLPRSVAELERLPGIGKYTARAVASFAFGLQVPVVDTNVSRVLAGFAGRELTVAETWDLAHRVLPAGRASDWNQALMDYGALLPKIKRQRSTKAAEQFNTTNRFWRGRIIDALREHRALSVHGLLEALPYPHRDEQRVRGLVRVLHDEGMIEYNESQDRVDLPE